MIQGKWRVHTLCTPNNTKMVDQIFIKFTRIAHRTQRTPIHINIFKRIDDVITCPLLVEPTRPRWFPLTREIGAGALVFVPLFAWTNCWTNIPIAAGLKRYRSHFHYWNFDRLSYSFKLKRCFIYSLPGRSFTRTMVHTCIPALSLFAGGRTDGRTRCNR